MSLRPQILYLVHRVPFPPNRGDRIRSFHILDYLSRRADIHLATLADEPVTDEAMQALHQRCRNVAIESLGRARWLRGAASLVRGRSATEGLFESSRLREVIRRWAGEVKFDAVVVFCSSMGPYLSLPEIRDVPAIVDLVDVDSEKLLQYAASAGAVKRRLYALEGQRLRNLEKSLTDRACAVTLVSESEARLWRSICPNDRTYAIQNGVDVDYFQPASVDGRPGRCIFVGALDYPPNIEGVRWFAKEVWPKVLGKCPTATFAIVGRKPHRDVRELANLPGIEVFGSVPDVRPYLAEASVAVAPLRIARGIQNKVLEAMAAGKPVVASRQALEGLDATPGEHVIEADSPEEWSGEIACLLKNVDECRRLAMAGRSFVLRHHNWTGCLGELDRLAGLPERAFCDLVVDRQVNIFDEGDSTLRRRLAGVQ